MNIHKELFSLKEIKLEAKDKHSVLTMQTGKGKTRKGFSWAVETSVKKDLHHIAFVTSEHSHLDLDKMVKDYIEHGEFGLKAENMNYSFIHTDEHLNAKQLAVTLERISTDKTCIVLDVIWFDNFFEDETSSSVLIELLNLDAVFGDILITQQTNTNLKGDTK